MHDRIQAKKKGSPAATECDGILPRTELPEVSQQGRQASDQADRPPARLRETEAPGRGNRGKTTKPKRKR